LWEDQLPNEAHGRSVIERGVVLDDHHETLGVTTLDGEPEIIFKMPSESYMPFALMLCLSAFFAGLLVHIWGLAAAAVGLGVIVVIAWLWPRAEAGEKAIAAP
jgi:cytochrome c oxidase subunit 1/cytochrome c oxidase subunit I+III